MIKTIIKLYNKGKTCQEIGQKFGISKDTVSKLLKLNNISIKGRKGYRKYTIDDSFFENIDTEAKAYWFGWLMADGYNQEIRGNIRLQIKTLDDEILKQFKRDIKFSGPVVKLDRGQSHVNIISRKISHDLAVLGCVQAKSLILKFPTSRQIPNTLLSHFIRGYFDGDGCISGKGTNCQLTIISTIWFCERLNDIFSKLIGKKNIENHPSNNITKRYRISGNKQIKIIYDYLYKNATLFLARKKIKFNTLCIS